MSEEQPKPGFLAELKRRKVLNSAAYYFAIAWGSVEFLEWVIARWAVTPPQWFLPLDREGIHRTTGGKGRGAFQAVLALVLMVGGTAGLYYLIGTPAVPERVLPPTVRPKLAVLPFEAFSADPEKIEFADAIHYELLSNLGRIGSLLVISRQSVMQYRKSDKPLTQIAVELGVDAFLTGAVQRLGNQIRIKVALRDGKHDSQVWSDDFDFEFTPDNYFEVQSEIAETVSKKFQLALAESDRVRIGSAPTAQLTAYDAYLLGRLKLAHRNIEEAEAAIELFKEAIRIDPDYALAYVGLSDSYDVLRAVGSMPQDEALEVMDSLLDNALSLDGSLGEAYTSLGHLRGRQGRLDEAEAAFHRALELSPNYPPLYSRYGTFLYYARHQNEACLQMHKKALQLDPRSAAITNFLAFVLEDMGRVDESLAHAQQAVELSPDYTNAYNVLGFLYIFGLTDYEKGIKQFAKADALDQQNSVAPAFLSLIYLDLLDEPRAKEWAQVAWDRAPGKMMGCMAKHLLAAYRNNPESAYSCTMENWKQSRDQYSASQLRDYDLQASRYAEARARYEENFTALFDPSAPRVSERNYMAAVDLYLVLSRTGDQELADRLVEGALEVMAGMPRLSTGGYGVYDVSAYALQGHTEEALGALRQAIDDGMRSGWWYLTRDLNLQSLWDEPRFKAIMAELESDMIARRERINANQASE
jgi:TolB-like protein